jgi:hypothetical protein
VWQHCPDRREEYCHPQTEHSPIQKEIDYCNYDSIWWPSIQKKIIERRNKGIGGEPCTVELVEPLRLERFGFL